MRKYLLLILIVLVSGSFVTADNSVNMYPKIYHPMDFTGGSDGNDYWDLMFAPVGWSKDGKFAYLTEIDPGGAWYDVTGFFRWVIQDTVTDKILWQSEGGLEKGLPEDLLMSEDKVEILKWVFPNMSKRYQPYFKKYGIILNPNLKLSSFPLKFKRSNYQASIIDVYRETIYEIPDLISKYKLTVFRNNVKKVVSQYNNNHSGLMDVQIAGYIKSPYEPLIAIALVDVYRGWEGPPNPVGFRFIGCHLEKGFKAP